MAIKTITVVGDPVRAEYAAGGTITPGHLLVLGSGGTVTVHATEGGTVSKMFALEDANQGREIDTDYTLAERVQVGFFRPGDMVLGLLANGETAVIGSWLESQGDGTLRVVDTDASYGAIAVDSVIGFSEEAVDMSGSSGADPSGRIKVRII